jgi:hypothetical protein
MADIAALQAQLDALKSARASGVRELRFGERHIFYKSDKEMVAAIAALEDEINQTQGAPRPRNVVLRSPPHRGW